MKLPSVSDQRQRRKADGNGPVTAGLGTEPRTESDANPGHLDCLLDAILFDRDFELGSGFLDEKPDTAAAARSLPGVTDSCFSVAAPDILSPDEHIRIESELRSLLSPHLTPGK